MSTSAIAVHFHEQLNETQWKFAMWHGYWIDHDALDGALIENRNHFQYQ